MSLTYSQYLSSIANLMVVPTNDPGFQAMQNNMIDDAELRLYRALNLLDETVKDTTLLTTGTRVFSLPITNGTFISVEQINVITPAGTTVPDNGTRNPVLASSKEMLDFLWPSATGSTVPTYFAPLTQDTFIVAPFPDQAYTVEVVGVQRPQPLYVSQTTSPLSVYFPDLFVAASMVFAAGYQRNFGAQSDNPQMSQSWEAHYNALLNDAKTEEARKRFLADRYQKGA